ncbi:MAG TPA: transcriptional regulator [Methanoregula sp.]|nr:transcriptional regulator [Methanoregula sp.]
MLNDSIPVNNDIPAEEIMDTFTRLFNKAAAIEREPVDTGDGILLYTSEVHLIDMAGRFPEEGLSSLAIRLGITKGAISQAAKKLEEKGYLERVNRQGNNKTIILRLTHAGRRAYVWHRAYHAVVNERIAREIGGLNPDARMNFHRLLRQLEMVFDDCPETRRRITATLSKENHAMV